MFDGDNHRIVDANCDRRSSRQRRRIAPSSSNRSRASTGTHNGADRRTLPAAEDSTDDRAAASWLAARILLRHIRGEPAKGDDFFDFSRNLH